MLPKVRLDCPTNYTNWIPDYFCNDKMYKQAYTLIA